MNHRTKKQRLQSYILCNSERMDTSARWVFMVTKSHKERRNIIMFFSFSLYNIIGKQLRVNEFTRKTLQPIDCYVDIKTRIKHRMRDIELVRYLYWWYSFWIRFKNTWSPQSMILCFVQKWNKFCGNILWWRLYCEFSLSSTKLQTIYKHSRRHDYNSRQSRMSALELLRKCMHLFSLLFLMHTLQFL